MEAPVTMLARIASATHRFEVSSSPLPIWASAINTPPGLSSSPIPTNLCFRKISSGFALPRRGVLDKII
jgi:hypothetical protein